MYLPRLSLVSILLSRQSSLSLPPLTPTTPQDVISLSLIYPPNTFQYLVQYITLAIGDSRTVPVLSQFFTPSISLSLSLSAPLGKTAEDRSGFRRVKRSPHRRARLCCAGARTRGLGCSWGQTPIKPRPARVSWTGDCLRVTAHPSAEEEEGDSWRHMSLRLSFDAERRFNGFLPPTLPPVKYADTAAHEPARGLVARIGSAATSQRLKAKRGFFRNSQRRSGPSGGEDDCELSPGPHPYKYIHAANVEAVPVNGFRHFG